MACHENNGPARRQLCKLVLKLQATKVRHVHVEKDAAAFGVFNSAQKGSGRVILRDLVA